MLVKCGGWFSDATTSMSNPQNLYLVDKYSYTNMLAFPLLSQSFKPSPSILKFQPFSSACVPFLPLHDIN